MNTVISLMLQLEKFDISSCKKSHTCLLMNLSFNFSWYKCQEKQIEIVIAVTIFQKLIGICCPRDIDTHLFFGMIHHFREEQLNIYKIGCWQNLEKNQTCPSSHNFQCFSSLEYIWTFLYMWRTVNKYVQILNTHHSQKQSMISCVVHLCGMFNVAQY